MPSSIMEEERLRCHLFSFEQLLLQGGLQSHGKKVQVFKICPNSLFYISKIENRRQMYKLISDNVFLVSIILLLQAKSFKGQGNWEETICLECFMMSRKQKRFHLSLILSLKNAVTLAIIYQLKLAVFFSFYSCNCQLTATFQNT